MDRDRLPIVVAVPDGDDDALLRFAAREALICGCPVRLLHVQRGTDRAHADDVVASALARTEVLAGPGVMVTGTVVTGAPVAAVLEVGEGVRAVVVRRRDVLHLQRAIAEDGRPNGTPVIICVPRTWSVVPDDERPVLVGVDDPGTAHALVTHALELAHLHETSLRVVHAWWFPRPYDTVIDARIGGHWCEQARASLADAVTPCRTGPLAQVPIELVVEHGVPAHILVAAGPERPGARAPAQPRDDRPRARRPDHAHRPARVPLPGRPPAPELRPAMTGAARLGRLAVVVVAAAILLAPSAAPPPPGSPGRALEVSPCVDLGPIRSVGDLNRFVRTTPGAPALRGADVGVDVRLGDSRQLWFFADTLQTGDDGPRFVRNTALLVDGWCAHAVTGPGQEAVVPDRADGVGYWPMSAVALDHGDHTKVVVLAQRVRTVGAGPFDFEALGSSAAVLTVADGGSPHLSRVVDLGPDDASPDRPAWGAATTLHRRWVYLYGTSTRPIATLHGFALRVARTRVVAVTEPSRWRYWDGHRWQDDPARAVPVIHERGGVSQTLSVFHESGRWWALSKQDEFLGTALAVWPADRPRGPFGPATPLLRIPCDASTGTLRYLALAHPDLLPRPGTVVVSWSRNDVDLADVCADPSLYRPRFRRVRLPER